MSDKQIPSPIDDGWFIGAIVGFGLTAGLYWWREGFPSHYTCPLWIGIGVAAALLIAVGYGVAKIWREPGRDGLKVTGLIYLSSLVIMTCGRIFTL